MKLESEYLEKGFKQYRLKLTWYHILILPSIIVLTGFIISLFWAFNYSNNTAYIHQHILKLSIEFSLLLVLAYLFSWFIYCKYSLKHPIIVGVHFKDKEELLLLKTRLLQKHFVNETAIPYKDINLQHIKNIYDPVSNTTYNGLFIYNLKKDKGLILKNHFSWHPIWYEKITKKLIQLDSLNHQTGNR